MAARRLLAIVALLALPLAGCSPAFEFLVLNATAVSFRLQGRKESCVVAPGDACSARYRLLVTHPNGSGLEYRPIPAVGQDVLMKASEHRLFKGFLVRLRFDGRVMRLVAAQDDSWTPMNPQPRGFPLQPSRVVDQPIGGP